jgi:hypothetical protein
LANEPVSPKSFALALGENVQVTTGGSFSFTERAFGSGLQSELSTFRIANAVAASAALPGVFNNFSLASYSVSSNREVRVNGYMHLFDGGPSDNLGVDALLSHAREWYFNSVMMGPKPGGCMLLIVDAFASNTGRSSLVLESDIRRPYDFLVDFNFMDAMDALLARRRSDTLQALGVPLVFAGALSEGTFVVRPTTLPARYIKPTPRFNPSVHVPLLLSAPIVERDEIGVVYRVTSARALDDPAAVATSLTCAVWHISLDDIVGVSPLRLKKNEQLFEYSGVFSYTSAPPGHAH